MKLASVSLAAASLSTGAQAMFGKKPPPKPKAHIVEGFLWKDPFTSAAIDSFEATCEAQATFPAREYTLHDLMAAPPKGLRPYGNALKTFFSGREYPGGWEGYDQHLNDRRIMSMNYHDIPLSVRLWIEEEERSDGKGKGLFGVFEKPATDEDSVETTVVFPVADKVDRTKDEDKIAIFAPGAVYHVLPLWVVEGSDCKDDLADLSKYKAKPEDGSVVGWVDHKKAKNREMDFKVRVQELKMKQASASETGSSNEETRLTKTNDEL